MLLLTQSPLLAYKVIVGCYAVSQVATVLVVLTAVVTRVPIVMKDSRDGGSHSLPQHSLRFSIVQHALRPDRGCVPRLTLVLNRCKRERVK